MACGEREDRHALRQRLSGPRGELRRLRLILRDEALEQALGFCGVRRVEDIADRGGDRLSHVLSRHVGARVLLQMKLAALPGNRREDRLARRLQPRMIVRDKQLYTVQSAVLQIDQELSPMHFRFRQLRRDAEDLPLAIRSYA